MEFVFDTTNLWLLGAAFVAGIVDSIAGGGGLITLPALMLSGLPPVTALGTNKCQSLFGAFSATIAYGRSGHVNINSQKKQAILAIIGGAAGAWLVTIMPDAWLRALLPLLLAMVAFYFAFKPNLDDRDSNRRLSPYLFTCLIPPIIGFYDGLAGPGTGSFFMLAFVLLAGFGILKATAHTKLLNFSSNLGSLAILASFGAVYWQLGLMMGCAQFIGAQLGAKLAISVGARLIKPLLVGVCILMAAKLLWDQLY